jgi:hypothetical protein
MRRRLTAILVAVTWVAPLWAAETWPTELDAARVEEGREVMERCQRGIGDPARCRDLREKAERFMSACRNFEAAKARVSTAVGLSEDQWIKMQTLCDRILARSTAERNAGWGMANQMEQERLRNAKTECERQWGNSVGMVEHCEAQARKAATPSP